MKSCKPISDKLVAYLHNELPAGERQRVEAHLEVCIVCRTELATHRATLELLGESLALAPAPVELTAWRVIPKRVSVRRKTFADYWYSPRLTATLATATAFCLFLMVSVSFVAVTVIEKSDQCFEAAPVSRPKMALRKLQAPASVKKKSLAQPKMRKPIVAKGSNPEIKMPEMMGESGGIGASADESASSFGFEMPQISSEAVFGYSMDKKSAAEPMPSLREEVVADADSSINKEHSEWKKMKPSLMSVSVPKTTRITSSMPRPSTPELQFPGLSGISDGLDQERSFGLEEIVPMEAEPPAAPAAAPVVSGRTIAMTEKGDAMDLFADSGSSSVAYASDKSELSDRLKRERPLKPASFNPYVLAEENAFSTFSIDVDTASYGLARQQLLNGGLPDPESVRTEEFVNSFDYDYRPPSGKQTFAVHSEMAPSPFRTSMDVLKLGIKGRRIGRDDHRGAVLTLVIDTSGSMATPERLGLVKQSLALLIEQLGENDKIAIVQFGGEARLVLDHTPASERVTILAAIDALQPGGPTQSDNGLELGYQVAITGFSAGDSNRIMIMSDGVANMGELDPEAILEQVAEQRKKGIYLSVLGFGSGSYDDDLLEKLANRGDGMYAYIDTVDEAQSVLVDNLAATLHVIASDVKIQVEFNPARVMRYRQLGYENRQLTKEQFRDDTVDAGEVGSGQSVTALYDVELNPDSLPDEPVATVYVRYRRADNGAIEEISSRVMSTTAHKRFEDAGARFQLAVCTAEFAEKLRRSPYAEGTDAKEILNKLQPAAMALDLDSQVQELLRLISITDGLIAD